MNSYGLLVSFNLGNSIQTTKDDLVNMEVKEERRPSEIMKVVVIVEVLIMTNK